MSTRIEMREDLAGTDHVRRAGGHDHFVRDLEARRRQAEAIVDGVHWAWTSARRVLARLLEREPDERKPTANDNRGEKGADAGEPGLLRRTGQSMLALLAGWQRRRTAVDELRALDDRVLADIGLRRDQIEQAVDGFLPPRGGTWALPAGRSRRNDGFDEELALAA